MTSKEALNDLRFNVSMSQDLNYKENNDLCDIIEKDLEVLDIIKRHPEYINFAQRFELTEEASEELKKVKEWLSR